MRIRLILQLLLGGPAAHAGNRVVCSRYFPGTAIDLHLVAFQPEQIAQDFPGPIKEVTRW
jgi:hypothetical protein